MEVKAESETVYRNSTDESHIVMNEKVQALAGSIYEEFEKMIARYDPDVVKNLMPLIVNVLESLDLAFTESQELEVEVELLKEDNEQLVTQYEREKQLRKCTEQRNLETEDQNEGERKELNVKIESLGSIVKMFELKAKNSQDQITRLEDKEAEQKREYTKLHERYTDLFKTHMDYMERSKAMLGTERMEQMQNMGSSRNRIGGMSLNQLNRSSGPVSYGYTELENNNPVSMTSSTCDMALQTPNVEYSSTSIKKEIVSPLDAQLNKNRRAMVDKGQVTDDIAQDLRAQSLKQAESQSQNDAQNENGTSGWVEGGVGGEDVGDAEEAEDISENPAFGPVTPSTPTTPMMCQSHTKSETRAGNNLYQELSFQDTDALADIDEGADLTDDDDDGRDSYRSYDNGMGKEVENLIMENNELLATKNALNIVKDDLIAKVDELTGEHEILREEIKSLQTVRAKLQQRVQELEEELKVTKEEAEKGGKKEKSDDEEEVPMAQRKRFTRVEMARVLMERNQYKERFMELQEAVRWTEMIRASKSTDPQIDKKNKQGIWKFFSNLFSGTDRPSDPNHPYLNMKYSGSDENVGPALSNMRSRSSAERKGRGADLFDGESISSDKLNARRAYERKEQYKQVRAHVKKDDGRLQAYGWSLPAKSPPGPASKLDADQPKISTPNVPVPVPVYCRPLMEKEPGMKIWCAAGVNLTGGRTKDGGDIVGASVFYSSPPTSEPGKEVSGEDEISKLDAEIKEGESLAQEAAEADQQLSSLVWICTSTHSISKVTVIDANNPADVLESFHVCSSHLLCIASVPGAKEDDYVVDDAMNKIILEESAKEVEETSSQSSAKAEEISDVSVKSAIGSISFVSCATGDESLQPTSLNQSEEESKPRLTKETAIEMGKEPVPSATEDTDAVHRRFLKEPTANIKDGLSEPSKDNEIAYSEMEKMSSVLPTMWLGSQSGSIYVHSAVSQWKRCIHSIRLKDSVLSIVHVKGRVLAALADGTVAIFHRAADGQWDLKNYYLLDLGKPHHSIRCMVQVHSKVWLGYRNRIHIVDPKMMCVEATLDAHPRKESQVRQMAWVGDGVWVSIRLDSTLRLYHAHTHEHLQDVDIEPYVSKMLGTGKLGFSFVRITALLVSCTRLWLGTGNGVIISVPLHSPEMAKSSSGNLIEDVIENSKPGGPVRVYSDRKDRVIPGSFIPYCSMSQAQLSFHGHRDAVKFFVSVPGHGGLSISSSGSDSGSCDSKSTRVESMLVMSGGEGYIDFRIVDDGTEDDYDSHIMVWQLPGGVPAPENLSDSQSSLLSSPTNSMRPISPESSSLELGPTPGSGMALDSQSESISFYESDSETDTIPNTRSQSQSVPSSRKSSLKNSVIEVENVENINGFNSDTYKPPAEPLAWSTDVESMLNNPPPSTFESFNLSREPSLSSWVIPQDMPTDISPPEAPYSSNVFSKPSTSSPSKEVTSPLARISESPDSVAQSLEPVEDFTGHPPGPGGS